MFDLEKIKKSTVINEPWQCIVVENYLEVNQAIELSKQIQNKFSWHYDNHPDMKGCVRISNDNENFEHFSSDEFCKTLSNKLGYELPRKYLVNQTNTWHTKGASLPPHTDMHCLKNINDDNNENYTMCITYQLYLPDTADFKHTGLWMHDLTKDKSNWRPKIKQLPCLPGVFFAYINTDRSYHSVPKQEESFNRVSHMGRIYW